MGTLTNENDVVVIDEPPPYDDSLMRRAAAPLLRSSVIKQILHSVHGPDGYMVMVEWYPSLVKWTDIDPLILIDYKHCRPEPPRSLSVKEIRSVARSRVGKDIGEAVASSIHEEEWHIEDIIGYILIDGVGDPTNVYVNGLVEYYLIQWSHSWIPAHIVPDDLLYKYIDTFTVRAEELFSQRKKRFGTRVSSTAFRYPVPF